MTISLCVRIFLSLSPLFAIFSRARSFTIAFSVIMTEHKVWMCLWMRGWNASMLMRNKKRCYIVFEQKNAGNFPNTAFSAYKHKSVKHFYSIWFEKFFFVLSHRNAQELQHQPHSEALFDIISLFHWLFIDIRRVPFDFIFTIFLCIISRSSAMTVVKKHT